MTSGFVGREGFDPQLISSSYDLIADAYATAFFDELEHKPFDRQLLGGFARVVVGRGRVADLGCGPGHVARWLAAREVEVLGIDLSLGMIEVARRLSPGLAFEQGDLTNLAYPPQSWAGATAFYSLIHLPRRRLPVAVREVHRVLRPDAPWLIAVHGGTGELHADEWAGRAVSLTATLYRLEELTDVLETGGFLVELARQRDPYDFELPTPRLYVQARRP